MYNTLKSGNVVETVGKALFTDLSQVSLQNTAPVTHFQNRGTQSSFKY